MTQSRIFQNLKQTRKTQKQTQIHKMKLKYVMKQQMLRELLNYIIKQNKKEKNWKTKYNVYNKLQKTKNYFC